MRIPRPATIVLVLYGVYLLLPIWWLAMMALSTNRQILDGGALLPSAPTLANFAEVFTNPVWYQGFANSLAYVTLNTVLSIAIALPAAYTFSRLRFVGDRHLFFWLLSNRMAPPAVFLLPFFQLYSAVGLFDTPWAVALAHCLFTVPLAVWILEGFVSGVPRRIDEMARVDGIAFPAFFLRIFLPLIRAGLGVTVFFCFMFSWVELLLARTLTATDAKPIVVVMTRTVSASGLDWGVLSAAGLLTIVPGLAVVWFVRGHLVKGFALGAGLMADAVDLAWMAWTTPTALFFVAIATGLVTMTLWERIAPTHRRRGFLPIATTRGDRFFMGLLSSAFVHLFWLGLLAAPVWIATLLCALWLGVLLRWG